MIRLLVLSLLLVCNFRSVLNAQTNPTRDYISNDMIWLHAGCIGKINNKFSYQLDVEYRRQADPAHAAEPNTSIGSSQHNMFKHFAQFAVRPWVHYNANKTFRFSLSPITYFNSLSAPVNGLSYFTPEYRTSIQMMITTPPLGRMILTHRYRYEFRFFGVRTVAPHPNDIFGPNESYDFVEKNRRGRLRYQLKATLPINKKTIEPGAYYAFVSTELFLALGKYVSNINLIDQARFNIGVGYKPTAALRVEIGYINQLFYRLNNTAKNNVEQNNIIFVNCIFDDFNSLFKKKETVTPTP